MKKIILLMLLIITFSGCNKESNIVSKDMSYMDTFINVKIYEDSKKAREALNKIDEIYQDYDKLADRYKAYDDVINVNYINNQLPFTSEIVIDERLYDMLAYSKSFSVKTKGLFNIALGNVSDVWATYREGDEKGVPSIDKLKSSGSVDDSGLVLMGNNKIIKTKQVSLDLGAIAKGYTTEVVGDYLDSIGLHKYLITAGTSSVKAGDHYNDGYYKVGLVNPKKPDEIYKTIKGNNIAVTTSGSFERYYEYEGVRYGHIIDPHTLFPANYMLSVMVVTDDAALGEILSTTLFLMPIQNGVEYLKDFDNVEAIWYGLDGHITTSDGMKQYE